MPKAQQPQQQGKPQQLCDRVAQLECALYLALDALEFDAGDWNPEAVERHTHEQIELARKHLRGVFDQEARDRLATLFAETANRPGDTK